MNYRSVADQETLDSLFVCSARDRQTLAKVFRGLVMDPFQSGDFEELDAAGRPVQVRLAGAFLLTFWADHAAKEVRIIRVEKID